MSMMEAVLREIATGDEDKIRASLKNFNDRVGIFWHDQNGVR